MKTSRFPHLASRFLLLVFFLALFFASPALAQDPTPIIPDDEVNAIAKEMFCPVCENVPLDVCPTQACDQWRELIRQRLAEGWSEQEIKNYFVEQYGDRVLAEPPRTGLNWLVYILPPVIVLLGLGIVIRVLHSWKVQTAQATASAKPPTLDDDYVRRLEDELKRRN
ncbi:MAG: cytochrome c-type biogenesis protein CcmH [Anaerolineales bacterium]|jgi:cytochrome c-type biogenesis protein CcmH|nr:cytochrome c-type biogenesis protein CcmH [Anaerolineales bacterium]